MSAIITGLLEISAAALFMVVASRKRIGKPSIKVVVNPVHWAVPKPLMLQAAPGQRMDIDDALAVNGIRKGTSSYALKQASSKGIVYHGNVGMAHLLLPNSSHPIVLDSELGLLSRRLYMQDPCSGIVAAHVMYGGIEIEVLHV